MLFRIFVLTTFTCVAGIKAYSQGCTTLGQTPATAFPVCGTDTFSQSTVPICGNTNIPVPCNDGAGYQDKNPFWYKFTCFTAGTLGFVITPDTIADDYDWQLFDVTGRNPADVFTDKNLFVCGNWSGEGGKTGASAAGTSNIACAGFGQPLFSKMPTLIQGHQYLLLISHFTDTQSGYKLSFGGGTASITDPKPPAMQSAAAGCGGITVGIKLNKKMKCSSLAADGSDFSIAPANGTVTGAIGIGCNNGFDMDSLVITMSNALLPGNYSLIIKNGNDNNTLFDNCNTNIPAGDLISFAVAPVQPTPLDSIVPIGCKPNHLQLIFRKPILCSSIAANGSDFVLTGPSPITVAAASGECGNGNKTTVINLTLSGPIQTGGVYQLLLQRGSDGNTIFDDCSQETPPGSSLNFNGYDTVSAQFNYQLLYGCTNDTVQFFHNGANAVNLWRWTFDNQTTSSQQNVVRIYNSYGAKQVNLYVSNGVCADSASATIVLDNELIAAFNFPEFLCPEDVAQFEDISTGNIVSWNWDFGNGNSSNSATPGTQQYTPPTSTRQIQYTVRLIVENDHNCFDTALHKINVVNTCRIAVPNAFTPNNDGHNDYLYPLNAWKADNLVFRVYNRYGQVVFETKDWTQKWDGTIGGRRQESGVYVWVLRYIDHDTQKAVMLKGTTVLIR